MTIIEQRYYEAVPSKLADIASELKKLNESLYALVELAKKIDEMED